MSEDKSILIKPIRLLIGIYRDRKCQGTKFVGSFKDVEKIIVKDGKIFITSKGKPTEIVEYFKEDTMTITWC